MADEPLVGFRAFLAWFGSGYGRRPRPAAERILSGSVGLGTSLGVVLGIGIAVARYGRYRNDMLLGLVGLFEVFCFGLAGLALGSLGGVILGVCLLGGRDALRRTSLWMLGGAVLCGLLGLLPLLLDPRMAMDVPIWVFVLAGALGGTLAGAHLGSRREVARQTGA